jgi:hypothetical protein
MNLAALDYWAPFGERAAPKERAGKAQQCGAAIASSVCRNSLSRLSATRARLFEALRVVLSRASGPHRAEAVILIGPTPAIVVERAPIEFPAAGCGR